MRYEDVGLNEAVEINQEFQSESAAVVDFAGLAAPAAGMEATADNR